jgi:zinc transport system substrate-binding protein
MEFLLAKLYIVINNYLLLSMPITSYRTESIWITTVFCTLLLLLLAFLGGTNDIANSSVENNVTNGTFAINQTSIIPSADSVSTQTNETTDGLKNKTIKVLASFFPIYEFVKEVGGDKVEANTVIPMGIEPHEYEPTIQQIQQAENADMIFFNGLGFEGSWIKRINNDNLVDTSRGTNITRTGSTTNPHIWLDPIFVKNQVKNIEDSLIKLDPTNKEYYQSNAINFSRRLDSLDTLIRSTLQKCELKDFIAFHDAFSYFANRYGLEQHAIQGISPEGEVLPQRIQEIIELARNLGINVIYSEELVDPRFAEVIAQEIPNGKVLVLSPIEGIKKKEQDVGVDYIDKMKENLNNLKIGLKCQ